MKNSIFYIEQTETYSLAGITHLVCIHRSGASSQVASITGIIQMEAKIKNLDHSGRLLYLAAYKQTIRWWRIWNSRQVSKQLKSYQNN